MVEIKNALFFPVINIITILTLISYKICDINIHVIPHTHLDPGWLNTPEEYYENERIEEIFDTIMNNLDRNKDRTFVINELFYFKKWYNNKSKDEKENFKKILEEKRIEFVSGGFVVNDEATPSYNDIMDQVRIGHQFLLEEFNITPKTAWYIDSFGHSAGNAHIMAELNYENLVLGRFHLDYLELLKIKKSTEFFWEPFGKKILTHILPLHYGFNLYQPELGLYNPEFKGNIKMNLKNLTLNLKESARGLHHNNIMYLYGDDFQYKDDNLFLNIEDLMNLIKTTEENNTMKIEFGLGNNETINFFYSTPEKYFNSIKNELKMNNKELALYKNIDFYPLRTDCFWTGYFTSRPYLKGYIRKASTIYYSISKYHSMNRLINDNEYINDNITISNLNELRNVVALNQHHDAITGTSKTYVSDDFIQKIQNNVNNVETNLKKNIEKEFNIKIGKICYNNYIVNQNNCSNQFLISKNSKNDKIKIGLLNPSFSMGINKVLINIEILDSKLFYDVEGIKSDFFCVDEKNLNNIEYYNYDNKCFLNFFYEFKKGEDIGYIILKKLTKGKKKMIIIF